MNQKRGITLFFFQYKEVFIIKKEMPDIIITKNQFEHIINFQNDKLALAEHNWNSFTIKEREYVLEMYSKLSGEKININEHWLNTVGDILGIFDPTGLVDFINGISYIKQKEYLFGLLSLISAVPYLGDVIAKPIMASAKVGGPSVKALKNVLATSKAGNTAKAASELKALTETVPLIDKFASGIKSIGTRLKSAFDALPNFLFGGLKRTLNQWVDLFSNAAKRGAVVSAKTAKLSQGFKAMSKVDQVKNLEKLIDIAKTTKGPFTGYRTSKGILSWKTLFRGVPQLMGRNASVRALMRQTKWWLGFLDFIGMGNYIGPEELSDEQMAKLEEYNQTPQAMQNFQTDFGQAIAQQGSGGNLLGGVAKDAMVAGATGAGSSPWGLFLGSLIK